MSKTTKERIRSVDPKRFTGIYAEIAAQIDPQTAVKIYEMLRGQMITFPQKLYDREYVKSFIGEHYSEYTVRELSRMFGYSDRRIRQFISQIKQE